MSSLWTRLSVGNVTNVTIHLEHFPYSDAKIGTVSQVCNWRWRCDHLIRGRNDGIWDITGLE